MKIELEVTGDPEGTESPWWVIVDASRNMVRAACFGRVDNRGVTVAEMITGPFFSRAEAEAHLKARRYAFSKDAFVYCKSGYWSAQYKDACRRAQQTTPTP